MEIFPRHLTIRGVCDNATRFWFSWEKVDYRGALLHSIFLLVLNLGLQNDHLQNIENRHVTVNLGILITGANFLQSCKTLISVYIHANITGWNVPETQNLGALQSVAPSLSFYHGCSYVETGQGFSFCL